MNIPNILTSLRIVLAVAIFCLFPFQRFALILLLFIIASLTDFLDGWWARRFNQMTVYGRIMDPFADKLLVCGILVAFLGVPQIMADPNWFGYSPWMVIVIIARELWVTSLRAVVESKGGDFSAKWVGKWKMGLQCATIIAFLLLLSLVDSPAEPFIYWIAIISLWGTILITIWSGVSYTVQAIKQI